MSDIKKVPENWQSILNPSEISRSISRISYEICEKHPGLTNVVIVGIKTAGEFLAKRVQQQLKEIESKDLPIGFIDITLHRDDIHIVNQQPVLKGTELDFDITSKSIILVDDVFYTGRTIRAALDAIIDLGRPETVELAILVDRGHRQFPIRPDYVGKNIPTKRADMVRVRLSEMGFEDGVYLVPGGQK